jgi:hypothetical protein
VSQSQNETRLFMTPRCWPVGQGETSQRETCQKDITGI